MGFFGNARSGSVRVVLPRHAWTAGSRFEARQVDKLLMEPPFKVLGFFRWVFAFGEVHETKDFYQLMIRRLDSRKRQSVCRRIPNAT